MVVQVVLFIAFGVLIWYIFTLHRKITNQNVAYGQLKSELHSRSVKHGFAWEQFVPFIKHFPYNKNNFKFLGIPVDGIAFEDGKIVLCEFKTGNSQLNNSQKKVKKLVEEGKVTFEEFRY
jgi:predicted Holliday junction resolvase-like endonuclease